MKCFRGGLGLGAFGWALTLGFCVAHENSGGGGGRGDGERKLGAQKVVRIEHEQRQVEGWTVQVDVSLLAGAHAKEGAQVLKILEQRLHRIIMRVPKQARLEMQKVPIYLDRAHPLGGAHFHPSKGWLSNHGYDPEMAHAIHLTNSGLLLGAAKRPNAGSVVLHELAHAYHFRVLGFDHAGVQEAYQIFCKSGKFEEVTYPGGRQRPHYGLMDEKEFFAEMTETFFTENDMSPYNRTDLMLCYPEGYRFMAEIWQVKVPEVKGKWRLPPTAWDLRMMAKVQSVQGKHEKALELVMAALELEPNNERIKNLKQTIIRQKKKTLGKRN